MNGTEFREAIRHLGLSQIAVSQFLGVNERTARRWASDEHPIPPPVAILLNTMIHENLKPEKIASFT